MKLVFGLGNPGKQYAYTLHNLGFLSVDLFLQSLDKEASKEKFHSLYTSINIEGEKCIFAKPLTFMNNSGKAVAPFFNSAKISPEDMIIIHDDVDIEEGKVRIKIGGGDGGHKGLRSIIDHLGGESGFLRIRIGIGRPPADMEVSDYVLRKATKSSILPFAKSAAEALEILLAKGYQKACNLINSDQ